MLVETRKEAYEQTVGPEESCCGSAWPGIAARSRRSLSTKLPGGRSTAVPSSTSDYFLTVLAVLGIEAKGRPQPADGVNLMPLIEGKMSARPKPIAFQTPGNDDRGKTQRLGSPDHALIGNRYKFRSCLDETRNGEDMLFDIAIDPGEQQNLVEVRPEVARSMKEALKSWDESCARSDRGEDYPSG